MGITPISIAEDMERELEKLGPEELRAVCERLRDEIRRRTVALASAMHELRTPLAVLDGYLEILHAGRVGDLNEKQREAIFERIPAAKLGTPDDVAAAAVFLASNEAAYINGQTIHVNGGMAMI